MCCLQDDLKASRWKSPEENGIVRSEERVCCWHQSPGNGRGYQKGSVEQRDACHIEVLCGGGGRTGLEEQDREMTGSSRERGEGVSRRERLYKGISNP